MKQLLDLIQPLTGADTDVLARIIAAAQTNGLDSPTRVVPELGDYALAVWLLSGQPLKEFQL